MSEAPLEQGDIAPDFNLLSTAGERIHLYEALEQHPAVLTFYLKAFTPVCTAQVCAFREAAPEFAAEGARIFGISSDSADLSRRFAKRENLPYPLLMDEDGLVRAAYRIPKLFGFLPGRVTFVIAPDRRIQHALYASFRGRAHAEQARASVAQSVRTNRASA